MFVIALAFLGQGVGSCVLCVVHLVPTRQVLAEHTNFINEKIIGQLCDFDECLPRTRRMDAVIATLTVLLIGMTWLWCRACCRLRKLELTPGQQDRATQSMHGFRETTSVSSSSSASAPTRPATRTWRRGALSIVLPTDAPQPYREDRVPGARDAMRHRTSSSDDETNIARDSDEDWGENWPASPFDAHDSDADFWISFRILMLTQNTGPQPDRPAGNDGQGTNSGTASGSDIRYSP